MVANGRLPPVEEGIVIFVVQACDVKRRGSVAFSLFSYYFLIVSSLFLVVVVVVVVVCSVVVSEFIRQPSWIQWTEGWLPCIQCLPKKFPISNGRLYIIHLVGMSCRLADSFG